MKVAELVRQTELVKFRHAVYQYCTDASISTLSISLTDSRGKLKQHCPNVTSHDDVNRNIHVLEQDKLHRLRYM